MGAYATRFIILFRNTSFNMADIELVPMLIVMIISRQHIHSYIVLVDEIHVLYPIPVMIT